MPKLIGSETKQFMDIYAKAARNRVTFNVKKASDWKYRSTVVLNNLSDLLKFVDENGDVIISASACKITKNEKGVVVEEPDHDANYELMIYDDL